MQRLNFFKKMILVFLLLFVSSMGWALAKPVVAKKISRNISSVESVMSTLR